MERENFQKWLDSLDAKFNYQPDKLAKAIQNAGIRGAASYTDSSPIFAWISKNTGVEAFPSQRTDTILAFQMRAFHLPVVMSNFIALMEHHNYPHLIVASTAKQALQNLCIPLHTSLRDKSREFVGRAIAARIQSAGIYTYGITHDESPIALWLQQMFPDFGPIRVGTGSVYIDNIWCELPEPAKCFTENLREGKYSSIMERANPFTVIKPQNGFLIENKILHESDPRRYQMVYTFDYTSYSHGPKRLSPKDFKARIVSINGRQHRVKEVWSLKDLKSSGIHRNIGINVKPL